MAQPTLYSRDYSFTAWSNANPSRPHSGSRIDGELDAVADTLEQTLENLALIQRDDGRLANQSVHPEAIRSDVWLMTNAWTPRGSWAGGTVYAFKDVIVQGQNLYVCLVAHTASPDFATDDALGRWMNFTANVDATVAAAAAALASETAAAASASAAAASLAAASVQADSAAASAVQASFSETAAASSATAAASYATAAATSAAVIPATAGHALEYLRIDSGGAAYERLTGAQVRADLDLGLASIDHVWWTGWPPGSTAPAQVARFGGRAFFGPAVLNDAAYYDGGAPGAPNGQSNLDWLGQLSRASYNGGDGVGLYDQNDINFSQLAVLIDYESTGMSFPGPRVAITAATRSLNSGNLSTPRVFNGFAIKDHADGLTIPVWCYYGEAHRLVAGDGRVHAMELEVRNSVDAITAWTPYVTTPDPGTLGLVIAAGCGLSATGQYAATAALVIGANPMSFGSGIIFLDTAIGAFGPGGSKPAIQLPYDNEIQWFKSGSALAAALKADNLGNFYITPQGGEVISGSSVIVPENAGLRFGDPGTGDTLIKGSSTSDYIIFQTANSERMRIKAAGSALFVPLSSAPSSPEEGEAYHDSTLDRFRVWNGSWWTETKRPFGAAKVTHSTTQSINNATETALTWDTEIEDTDSLHDTGTNPSRMTVPSGVSRVRLSATAIFDTNGSGTRQIRIIKNGSVEICGNTYVGAGFNYMSVASGYESVSAGDYFEVLVLQTSGGALNILNQMDSFTMEIVE